MSKVKMPTLPNLERMKDVQKLQKTMDRLARTANDRLLKLERSGLDASSPAYRAAQDILGPSRQRFSRSKNLTAAQMKQEIKKSMRFLNMQTSTIKGENIRADKMFNKLKEEALIDENTDQEKFNEFLKSSAWKALKNIDSSQIMGEASVAIANGKNIDDLIEMFKSYEEVETEMSELEVFESWTGIEYGTGLPKEWTNEAD